MAESILSIKTHGAQGCDFKYDFEFPKTHADILNLLWLKSCNLQKMTLFFTNDSSMTDMNIEGI